MTIETENRDSLEEYLLETEHQLHIASAMTKAARLIVQAHGHGHAMQEAFASHRDGDSDPVQAILIEAHTKAGEAWEALDVFHQLKYRDQFRKLVVKESSAER